MEFELLFKKTLLFFYYKIFDQFSKAQILKLFLIAIFHNSPPLIPTSKAADNGIFQIFECSEGELEYEQDVPGKMIEPLENGESIPDVAWEIRMKCNKETKIAYGPWADRQRLLKKFF